MNLNHYFENSIDFISLPKKCMKQLYEDHQLQKNNKSIFKHQLKINTKGEKKIKNTILEIIKLMDKW